MLEPGACEYARVSITRDRAADPMAVLLIERTIDQFLPPLQEQEVLLLRTRPAAMVNWHCLIRLESPEERQLYPVVLGIGPIRIGGTDPVCHQRRSNFLSKIMEHIGIVRRVADVDTLCRS